MPRVSRQRLGAVLWLAALVAALYGAFFQSTVRNDMTSFMPRAATPVQRLLMNELREGPVARLTIITLGGVGRNALAAASKQLAARLRASGAFVRVANGEQLFDDAERDRLFAYRYLLSPAVNAERFTEAALRDALRSRLRELASPVPYFDRPWLAQDPTAEMRTMLMAWRGQARPRSYRGVWFDAAGEQALLLAQTRAPGFDLDAQDAAQGIIRDAVAADDASVELGLSGPGVFAVTSREIVRADTRRLGVMAGVAALVILLVSYRSVRLLVIGGLPLLFAVAAGIVAVNGIFGAIHGIVLAFGITVIGVAIDYPIHLFSHLNAGESVRRSLDSVWPTIRLGAITTAMGYLAMSGTDFPGLTQFATFAVAGLLAAAACTRWGLVGWLPDRFVPRYPTTLSDRYRVSPRPGRGWAGLALAAGAVALVYLVSHETAPWEDDIAALSPIPESVMARDRHLHAQLGVPDTNHILVLEAPNAQAALESSEAIAEGLATLVTDGVITSFDLPSRYLPSAATQRARQQGLPEPAILRADLARARAGTPFKEDLFAPFAAAVAAARTLPPLLPGDLEGTTLGLRLRSSLLPVGDRWVVLITLSGVEDADALRPQARHEGSHGGFPPARGGPGAVGARRHHRGAAAGPALHRPHGTGAAAGTPRRRHRHGNPASGGGAAVAVPSGVAAAGYRHRHRLRVVLQPRRRRRGHPRAHLPRPAGLCPVHGVGVRYSRHLRPAGAPWHRLHRRDRRGSELRRRHGARTAAGVPRRSRAGDHRDPVRG
jgi:predicted exporter